MKKMFSDRIRMRNAVKMIDDLIDEKQIEARLVKEAGGDDEMVKRDIRKLNLLRYEFAYLTGSRDGAVRTQACGDCSAVVEAGSSNFNEMEQFTDIKEEFEKFRRKYRRLSIIGSDEVCGKEVSGVFSIGGNGKYSSTSLAVRYDSEEYRKFVELKEEFEKIFNVPIFKFFNPIFGFDVIEFDKWVGTPDGVSCKEWVRQKYGDKAVDVVQQLINIRCGCNKDIKLRCGVLDETKKDELNRIIQVLDRYFQMLYDDYSELLLKLDIYFTYDVFERPVPTKYAIIDKIEDMRVVIAALAKNMKKILDVLSAEQIRHSIDFCYYNLKKVHGKLEKIVEQLKKSEVDVSDVIDSDVMEYVETGIDTAFEEFQVLVEDVAEIVKA